MVTDQILHLKMYFVDFSASCFGAIPGVSGIRDQRMDGEILEIFTSRAGQVLL